MPSSTAKSSSEHVVYTQNRGGARLIIGVYVEDLIIIGSSCDAIQAFKDEMKSRFEMSDLGLLSYYLRIEVEQSADDIFINQAAYANKILEHPSRAPMEARLKLSKKSSAEAVNATEYPSVIGAPRYLLHTRPELAFPVGYLSRFMEEPHQDHLIGVKHVLRYVAGTRGYGIHYTMREEGPPKLISYSDAVVAGDIDTRKSTSGVVFFLGGNPVSWWHSLLARASTSQRPRQRVRASG